MLSAFIVHFGRFKRTFLSSICNFILLISQSILHSASYLISIFHRFFADTSLKNVYLLRTLVSPCTRWSTVHINTRRYDGIIGFKLTFFLVCCSHQTQPISEQSLSHQYLGSSVSVLNCTLRDPVKLCKSIKCQLKN